jgi:protein-disulfide isomerase
MQKKLTLAAIAVALVAAAGWFTIRTPEAPLSFAAVAQDAEVDTSLVTEMRLGNADAPVTVVEYASFTCPHCQHFHETVFGQLKANYIDTGKINFIYREVYFDRFGLWAGMVARCGDGQRYFGIADMIYDKQSEWIAGGDDPAKVAANLRTIGKTAGLSDEQLDACMADSAMAQAMVAVYQENAERDEVTSTPSFRINGGEFSNMSYEDFAKVLDSKLGG